MDPINVRSFIPDGPTALLIVVLVLGIVGFVKGYVVPKPVYDREVKRAEDATVALHKNNENIEDLASEMRRLRRNE